MDAEKPRLLTTVFSDYICPFCYVGDARLDRLREHYDLKVNWCSLEIHPETSAAGVPVSELGYEDATWQRMMESLERLAQEEGLTLASHGFSTNSHRAILLAEAAKRAGADTFYRLHKRLFEAYLGEGKNIGDAEILSSLATQVGVSSELVEQAWTDPRFEERLLQNHKVAHELSIKSTPTIFIGEQRLDGVVPFDEMMAAAEVVVPLP